MGQAYEVLTCTQAFNQVRQTPTAGSRAGERLFGKSCSDPRPSMSPVLHSKGQDPQQSKEETISDMVRMWADEHGRGLATNPFCQDLFVLSNRVY